MKTTFKNAFRILPPLSQSRARKRLGMLALGVVGFGAIAEAQPTLPTDSVARPLIVHRDTSVIIWPADFIAANGLQLTLANLAAVEAITGDLATQAELDAGLALKADASGNATDAEVAALLAALTKSDVGLANVDNTSDAAKPVSTAAQTALDAKADASNVLELDNTDAFTPSADYHPATKKYIDDQVIASGSGDVVGPAAAVNERIAVFDGTTGKLIKDSGVLLSDKADAAGNATDTELAAHADDTANPHAVTKAQVGLANVDNTSDAAKPVSTATQTALNAKADASNVLELDNTDAFTPDADYEPATKKYVDDNAGGGNTLSDLAGGTALTSGVDYFDTISGNPTLTVTGSTSDGATTSLTFDCATEQSITIWSSYRIGETSATTGPLVFAAGNHKIAWERKDGKWYVFDSAVDDETAGTVYAAPGGGDGKPAFIALTAAHLTAIDTLAELNSLLSDADLLADAADTVGDDNIDWGTGAGQVSAADVPVAATPANYTPGSADVEGHLSGLDTAIGALGGGHDAVTLAGSLDYLTLSGQEITRGPIVLTTDVSGTLPIANGGTGAIDASAARTALDVDQAGTDNSTPVTLAGSLDYLTLSGQEITRGPIVLTTDVSGTLPIGNGGTGATDAAGIRTAINVADGATANDTDANLKARANHTGTQAASTISDFDTEVANNSAVTANTAKTSNATHTGDVTGSGALTIANDAVSNAKLANMAEATVKGRASAAGTGDPVDLTPTQVRTIINVADGATANDTDANLKARANHTGTQAASTISDFAAVVKDTVETSFALTIDAVADSMDYGIGYVPAAFTISRMVFVHAGAGLSTPDIDVIVRQGTDRSATGTAVVTAGTTVTSSTTGSVVTSFNDATCPAGSFLWVETSSASGTTANLEIFIFGTYD